MSSLPSRSTSNTPAASNTLSALIVCCFHFGSPAWTEKVQATIASTACVTRNDCIETSPLVKAVASVGIVFVITAVVGMNFPAERGRRVRDEVGGRLVVGVGQFEVDRSHLLTLDHSVSAQTQRSDFKQGNFVRLAIEHGPMALFGKLRHPVRDCARRRIPFGQREQLGHGLASQTTGIV